MTWTRTRAKGNATAPGGSLRQAGHERAALYGLLSRAVEALAPVYSPSACAAREAADGLGPQDGTLSG